MTDRKRLTEFLGECDHKRKKAIHLCNLCKYEFPTCKSGKIKFGIDVDNSLTGKDADKVLECDGFEALE